MWRHFACCSPRKRLQVSGTDADGQPAVMSERKNVPGDKRLKGKGIAKSQDLGDLYMKQAGISVNVSPDSWRNSNFQVDSASTAETVYAVEETISGDPTAVVDTGDGFGPGLGEGSDVMEGMGSEAGLTDTVRGSKLPTYHEFVASNLH